MDCLSSMGGNVIGYYIQLKLFVFVFSAHNSLKKLKAFVCLCVIVVKYQFVNHGDKGTCEELEV